MGFFGKLLGMEKELPALDPTAPGASRIVGQKPVLEAFAAKLHDKLELVPGEEAIYAFIGHPPDRFGIAWFEADGAEHNLKTLVQRRKLSARQTNVLSDHLRAVYERHQGEPRFGIALGSKACRVIPSPSMAKELHEIIHADVGEE